MSGEASPYYLYDPRICDEIRALAPQVKIIALLRDPVNRSYSHYQERVGQGVEPMSFRDALLAEEARLSVRELSEDFIEEYLEAEWPEVGYCVGVFRLEGRGVQLFTAIEGDYFSVLGMPLVALLGALRARGVGL